MTRVYWDTILFAYWLQDNAQFKPLVTAVRSRMAEREDRLCASLWTLCELMVLPCQQRSAAGMAQLQSFFYSPAVELLPLAPQVAVRFGEIRASTRIASADALHLAIAATAGVNLFLTNDRRLHQLKIPGIDFITGLDTNLY